MVEGTPVAGPNDSPAPPSSPQLPPSGQIDVGDCVSVADFAMVDCAQPHEIEVYRFDPLPADFPPAYPTAATLLPQFEPRCRVDLLSYLGSQDADASRLRELLYWPARQDWNSGQRWVLCAVVEIGPDDRPVRRTGRLGGALRDGLGQFQACSADRPSEGTLRVVPCAEPHHGEAVPGVLVLGAASDPPITAERANTVAEPHCRRVIDAFLGDEGDLPEVRYSWRYPLATSWPNGYTSVVCYVETDIPITGSLRARS